MTRKLVIILLIVCTVSLIITGCPQPSEPSSNGNPSTTEPPTTTQDTQTPPLTEDTKTPPPPEGTQAGNLAPNFQLQDLDGQSVSLSELRGSPIILNFWATWCGPCRSEMPFIQEIYKEWQGRGLVVLAINLKEAPSEVSQFMQKNNLSFTVLLDTGGEAAQIYDIFAIPTTLFIDRDGIIRERKLGAFLNKEEIEDKLGKIMP